MIIKLIQWNKFIFVRLKFYEDIRGRSRKLGQKLTDSQIDELMEEIRDYILTKFVDPLKPRLNILIISALMEKIDGKCITDNREEYEFEQLQDEILNMFEDEKKNAFVFSLLPNSKKNIQMICDSLRKRIITSSSLSAAGGLTPIPGVSVGIDLAILVEEVCFYIYKLGISQTKVKDIADLFDIEHTKLNAILDKHPIFKGTLNVTGFVALRTFSEGFKKILQVLATPVEKFLLEYFSKYFAANAVEEVAKTVLPLIGSVVGFVGSGITTYYTLHSIIDSYQNALLDIHDFCIKNRSR